jgi:hypothetical protein
MPYRKAQQWDVYWNGQKTKRLQPLKIESTIGAGNIDFAELQLDPKLMTTKIRNEFNPLADIGVRIDVVAVGAGSEEACVHSGVISQVLPHWNSADETIRYVSRTERQLFGIPNSGMLAYWPNTSHTFLLLADPIVFNPEIDGRTRGNMHSRQDILGTVNGGPGAFTMRRVFIDPEASRNAQERSVLGGAALEWKLSDAVLYLCQSLNKTQFFIKNPTIDELVRQVDDARDLVRNIEIPFGAYLPEALDALLNPLGYYWFVERSSRTSRNIVIQQRGTGGKVVSLFHQKVGEKLDTNKTSVEALSLTFDADRLANTVYAYGSRQQLEITVELVKAWPEDLDGTRFRDLKRSRHHLNEEETPDIVNAYRKWVLNETGAYINTRTETRYRFHGSLQTRAGARTLLDSYPRPRPLLPTLTTEVIDGVSAPIGRFSGIEVEYLGPPTPGVENETAEQREARWQPAGNWGIEILKSEGGIYISGEDAPVELVLRRSDAALRVTATIEMDFEPVGAANRVGASPQPYVVSEALDLDGQFHLRQLSSLSKYHGAGRDSTAVDDRAAIQAYAEMLRERFDSVDVSGPVVIEGVDHHEYRVGLRVEGVRGKRRLFDNRTYRPTIPMIAGVTLDIMAQKTTLQLMRMKGPSL